MHIRIVRDGSRPLSHQIADALRRALSDGALAAGERLPSTRDLAKDLGVHRRSVVQAYRALEAEGAVVSGVGQGTFVAKNDDGSSSPTSTSTSTSSSSSSTSTAVAAAEAPAEASAPLGGAETGLFPWAPPPRRLDALLDPWRIWAAEAPGAGAIRFTGATADPSLFPAEEFRGIVDEVFGTWGARALDYGQPEGLLSLREWVAGRLADRGVRVGADQVLIVSGSQQGLDLLARLLVVDGDRVLVEEPGYANGFRLFQAHGAQVAGVPMDEGGIDLDALERVCRGQPPRLLYLMPVFQNPTGLSLARERIAPLLSLCARHRIPILEDQFDADLAYDGPPPAPVKGSDREEQVVLLGSFSKILFPGLRLGWMAAPRALLPALRELKLVADFSTGLLVQHAMELYCRRGLLDRHLDRVREIYGRRLRVMLDSMDREFPAGVRFTRPAGGLTLWVSLPPGWDALGLLRAARQEGVDFSPGPLFFPNGGGSGFLRLSYIRETEARIEEGIAILGRLLKGAPAHAESASAGPFI